MAFIKNNINQLDWQCGVRISLSVSRISTSQYQARTPKNWAIRFIFWPVSRIVAVSLYVYISMPAGNAGALVREKIKSNKAKWRRFLPTQHVSKRKGSMFRLGGCGCGRSNFALPVNAPQETASQWHAKGTQTGQGRAAHPRYRPRKFRSLCRPGSTVCSSRPAIAAGRPLQLRCTRSRSRRWRSRAVPRQSWMGYRWGRDRCIHSSRGGTLWNVLADGSSAGTSLDEKYFEKENGLLFWEIKPVACKGGPICTASLLRGGRA